MRGGVFGEVIQVCHKAVRNRSTRNGPQGNDRNDGSKTVAGNMVDMDGSVVKVVVQAQEGSNMAQARFRNFGTAEKATQPRRTGRQRRKQRWQRKEGIEWWQRPQKEERIE